MKPRQRVKQNSSATTKKRFVTTPRFLGADQKVTRSYKWTKGTIEMNRP